MKLTKNELSYLGKIYETSNPLALFSNIDAPLLGDEEKTLKEKKVLIEGKTTDMAHKLFEAAANPQHCTRLVLKDGFYFMEKYAYKNGEYYTIAENDGGEVIFSSQNQLDEVLFQLSQWVGMSDLKTFDIGATLSNNEIIVLLALVDNRRTNALLTYLGKEVNKEISFAQIRQQLDKPEQGSLTSILTGNYNYATPEIEETKGILDQLIAKRIVEFNKGYLLLEQYEEFAVHFLIPQTVVMLETFNLISENEIEGAGVLCVCAGMREILSMAFVDGAVEMTSISGRQLLKMMEDFLHCPDVVSLSRN